MFKLRAGKSVGAHVKVNFREVELCIADDRKAGNIFRFRIEVCKRIMPCSEDLFLVVFDDVCVDVKRPHQNIRGAG